MSGPGSFYVPVDGDLLRSTPATTSPWDAGEQHGGPPAALLARALERHEPRAGSVLARLTVEFLGTIPQGDASVSVRMLRPGRRVQLLEGSLTVDGRDVALARGWRIATEDGRAPTAGEHRRPPAVPEPAPTRFFRDVDPDWGYGHAVEWRFVEGALDRPGPARVWSRVRLPLVADEPISPVQRVMVVADSVNGMSAELELGEWLFVPTSLTVTLHRYPVDEWVFMDARTVVDPNGVGTTQAELADQVGPLGTVSQPLYVARRG